LWIDVSIGKEESYEKILYKCGYMFQFRKSGAMGDIEYT
jgi:hypothetical protein